MSYTEVKDSTSSAVGSETEGSVFDVTVTGYGRLRTKAEDFMIKAIKSNHQTSFRHYFTRARWTTVGDDSTVVGVTPELDQPLQVSPSQQMSLISTIDFISGIKRLHILPNENTRCSTVSSDMARGARLPSGPNFQRPTPKARFHHSWRGTLIPRPHRN